MLLICSHGKSMPAAIFRRLNRRDILIGETRLGHLPVLRIKELPYIFF
jgi:hypothetical protein